jgi:small subunit ribosomal protein S16
MAGLVQNYTGIEYMVVIRLARAGAKDAFYHIVAADKRNRRDGRFIERLGFYDPAPRGKAIGCRIDLEKVDQWVKNGAQVSDTVSSLVKQVRKNGNPEAATAQAA